MASEEPKKKRRQNVACDCCKLRRVKCDLSILLQYRHLASVPTAVIDPASVEDIPLAQLAQQFPDVGCTNCIDKELKCTTVQIVNPTRPKKTGRRIDEARRTFGTDNDDHGYTSFARTAPDAGTSISATAGIDMDFSGGGRRAEVFNNMGYMMPSHPAEFQEHLSSVANDVYRPAEHAALALNAFEPSPAYPELSTTTTNYRDITNVSYNPPTLSIPTLSHPSSPESNPRPPDALDPFGRFGTASTYPDDEAASVWEHFTKHPRESVAQSQMGEHSRQPHDHPYRIAERGNLLGDIWQSYQPSEGILEDPTGSGRNYVSPEMLAVAREDLTNHQEDDSPYPQSYSLATLERYRRKRNSPESPAPSPGPSKVVVRSSNPWKLWNDRGNRGDRIVMWGRSEAVQERLADRALGMELSRHLVKTFFQAVHTSFPAISPEVFYLEWTRSGQRSDRMTPAQEVLCSAIEAWGARYSDSPVILGLGADKAKGAPKVIQPNGTLIPGTQARAHWGRARLSAYNALVERVRQLIDTNGILRRPSITGLQALTLYQQLLYMSSRDEEDEANHYMEGQMIHSTIVEQMQVLGLMWDSDGPIITDSSELPLSMTQLRMKQRRLFWTHAVGDALWAAGSGIKPKIPQSEIDSAGKWLDTVREHLPVSFFKALNQFLTWYHRIVLIAREIAAKLSIPSKKKGTIDVPQFCDTIRKIWKDLDNLVRDMSAQITVILGGCIQQPYVRIGFSPLNYLVNLRLATPFLLLIVHQALREQLEFRRALTPAYIISSEGSPESDTSAAGDRWRHAQGRIDSLETLSRDSIDVLLRACRAQVTLFKVVMPTGIVQTASILIRDLVATAQLLAEVPTNEQGYPEYTPGGYLWTWETKQREVDCCVEALYQAGWGWSDIADILDTIMVTMERMTPTATQIDAYRAREASEAELSQKSMAAARKAQNDIADDGVLSAAMKHWPPENVPDMIERILQTNPDSRSESIEPSPAFPWKVSDQTSSGSGSESSPSTGGSKGPSPINLGQWAVPSTTNPDPLTSFKSALETAFLRPQQFNDAVNGFVPNMNFATASSEGSSPPSASGPNLNEHLETWLDNGPTSSSLHTQQQMAPEAAFGENMYRSFTGGGLTGQGRPPPGGVSGMGIPGFNPEAPLPSRGAEGASTIDFQGLLGASMNANQGMDSGNEELQKFLNGLGLGNGG